MDVVGATVVEVGVVAGRPVVVVILSVELVASGTSRFVRPESGPSTLYNTVRKYQNSQYLSLWSLRWDPISSFGTKMTMASPIDDTHKISPFG